MTKIPYPNPHPNSASSKTAVAKIVAGPSIDRRLYFQKGLEDAGSPGPLKGFATSGALESLAEALRSHTTKALSSIQLHDRGDGRPLVNPQAAWADDGHIPSPWFFKIPSPPEQDGKMVTTAAEMIELYWMAAKRDLGFSDFGSPTEPLKDAIEELKDLSIYLVKGGDPNKPSYESAGSSLSDEKIFRGGDLDSESGDHLGPYLSQFLTLNIPYGTLEITQEEVNVSDDDQGVGGVPPHLTDPAKWAEIQSGLNPLKKVEPKGHGKRLGTMLDLSRYVHVDQLYEAYLNAALILLGKGFNFDEGGPYGSKCGEQNGAARCNNHSSLPRQKGQEGFGTFGPTHVLTTVCEVATRALKTVWHQKWVSHLRLRPEAFGGIVNQLVLGTTEEKKEARAILDSPEAVSLLEKSFIEGGIRACMDKYGLDSAHLPMVYPEGSPMHPAYGAGHATVAGACVTVLKAFFDGEQKLIDKVPENGPLQAGLNLGEIDGNGDIKNHPDSGDLTVNGELNKLASNISIGRNMAGVHWRSDYTQSILLGQRLAISLLYHQRRDFHENPWFLSMKTFGGNTVYLAYVPDTDPASDSYQRISSLQSFQPLKSVTGPLDGIYYSVGGNIPQRLLGPNEDFRNFAPSASEYTTLQAEEAELLAKIV